MPIRRAADPINVKRIWDAIRHASFLQEPPDLLKIVSYLEKTDSCAPAQAELYIKQILRDGLITAPNRPPQKALEPTQVFAITTQELPELDGKDWYCFECHLAGDVTVCMNCFRVFHSDCIPSGKRKFEAQKKTIINQILPDFDSSKTPPADNSIAISDSEEHFSEMEIEETVRPDESVHSSTTNGHNVVQNYIYDATLCSICNIANIDTEYDMDKAEMNYLLKFVLHRIRSWLPTTLTHTMAQEDRPQWLTDSELTWRAHQLFVEHKDMSVIEVNINTESYSQFSEFLADVLTVQHNVAVFHGMESQEYGAAELMVRDTIHDITELRNCPDCYKHSNEKINTKWFCLPCRRPHKLVWAKQKGYPYWPAKVIKETSTHFDVRFFGGKYERALLVKSLIKPISVTKESLQIKSTASFNKAFEELQFHQRLLDDPSELAKLKAVSKPRKRSVPKARVSILNNSASKQSTSDPRGWDQKGNTTGQSVETDAYGKRKIPSNVVKSPSDKRKKPDLEMETNHVGNSSISGNVIDISDGEEESGEFSFRENNCSHGVYDFEDTYEQVSSSTETFRRAEEASPRRENGMQQLDHPFSDSVEKMRRKMECLTDKKDLIKCAMECMQMEMDKNTNDHNEHLKRLFESHNAQISETKKKQWCFNCEQDAIYHCCWNTAYCSQTCQQQHWQAEHKKVCRRKR